MMEQACESNVMLSDDELKAQLAIRFQSVTKRFEQRIVLRNLSLVVNEHQSLVVAGPNGSGKSTLLKLAVGLIRPSSGEVSITVAGKRLNPSAARFVVGYISPELAIYNELTAVENLTFFATVRGLHLSHDELAGLLSRVGLKGRGRDRVSDFSSGMRQRLKLACAVLHHPPILIFDEPTSCLDEDGAGLVQEILEKHRRYGVAMIATNEPREREWGTDVYWINRSI